MLKTIQIINHMKKAGHSKSDIYNELAEITDNYRSCLFELSDYDCHQISKIFNNDSLLDSAFKMSFFTME